MLLYCRPKSGGGNDDFLFEFEAAARSKEAPRGGIQMVADSSHPPAPAPAAAAPPPPRRQESGLGAGVGVRQESSGNDFAPDSKTLLARVNRWWKRVDEEKLQPIFGGPSLNTKSPHNKSFSVPATSRAG